MQLLGSSGQIPEGLDHLGGIPTRPGKDRSAKGTKAFKYQDIAELSWTCELLPAVVAKAAKRAATVKSSSCSKHTVSLDCQPGKHFPSEQGAAVARSIIYTL